MVRPRSAPRDRKASLNARRMRRTSSASCSSSATMSLLISTVLSGSRNRLAPLVDAPWTMPGILLRCSARTSEHIPAVALGDDLILEVFRRVLAAQIRLQRAAQAGPLLPQPIANHSQLRARVIDDVAGRIDLVADVADLDAERRGRRTRPIEDRRRLSDMPDGDARLLDRFEKRRQRQQPGRLPARGPERSTRSTICGRSADARSGNVPCREI